MKPRLWWLPLLGIGYIGVRRRWKFGYVPQRQPYESRTEHRMRCIEPVLRKYEDADGTELAA